MYTKLAAPTFAGAPAAVLAYTGINMFWIWAIVLGCTLTAAGFAVLRLIPRREK